MFENITKANKNIKFYTTKDERFKRYGRVLNENVRDVIEYLDDDFQNMDKTQKASYKVHVKELEKFDCFKSIQKNIFGELPIQIGVVAGRNQSATGTEYHQGSEVNVAISDCILVLGNKNDMMNDTVDIDQMDLFYIEKGEVIEIYSTTLHYTPIEVDSNGFSLVVVLIEGTNTDIPFESGSVLCKKNKWYVCHESQSVKIEQGFKVGLTGELLTLKYE